MTSSSPCYPLRFTFHLRSLARFRPALDLRRRGYRTAPFDPEHAVSVFRPCPDSVACISRLSALTRYVSEASLCTRRAHTRTDNTCLSSTRMTPLSGGLFLALQLPAFLIRLNPALYISARAKEDTWFEHETILIIAHFADPG